MVANSATPLEEARSLILLNRSPTWIKPEFGGEFSPAGRDTVFTEEQKEEWANNPASFLKYRKAVEASANSFYSTQFKKGNSQKELFDRSRALMYQRLGNEDLASILIPTFAVGCRR